MILFESQKEFDYIKTILDWTEYKKINLLYRGTKHGSSSKTFHEKCDNQSPTVTLYKNEKGFIFGGFTSIPWTSDGLDQKDTKSFLFTLTNQFGTKATKFKANKKGSSIYCQSEHGPCFGVSGFIRLRSDIMVKNDFLKEKSLSEFPLNYDDSLGHNFSIFTGNKSNNFKIIEIEVFKLSN